MARSILAMQLMVGGVYALLIVAQQKVPRSLYEPVKIWNNNDALVALFFLRR